MADPLIEFYNTTQYGREYVIGRNCRFLQGPKSSNSTVKRLIDALTAGQEICETILNYRRDGSPFVNLLMLAPLYDNKGQVRYFLGCQIDVSSLIEGGRGIESFAQLLAQNRAESRFGDRLEKDPKYMLGEFSAMLSEEDSNIVKNRTRRYSEESNRSIPQERLGYRGRRILGMEDTPTERALWPHVSLGPSGRLPGVYQNVSTSVKLPLVRIQSSHTSSTSSSALTRLFASPSPLLPFEYLACSRRNSLTVLEVLNTFVKAFSIL